MVGGAVLSAAVVAGLVGVRVVISLGFSMDSKDNRNQASGAISGKW
jgi:hypothetical protein